MMMQSQTAILIWVGILHAVHQTTKVEGQWTSNRWNPYHVYKYNLFEAQTPHHYQLRKFHDQMVINVAKDGFREVSCLSNEVGNNDKHRMTLSCQPKKMILPLSASNVISKVTYLYPNHVEVNWCTGYCDLQSINSCVPVKLREREIHVTAYTLTSSTTFETKCYVVKVNEHESCQCACGITKNHCDAAKTYNPKHCRCECINEDTLHAKCADNKIWNPITCACECAKIVECSSKSRFNFDMCKCVSVKRVSSKNSLSRLKNPGTRKFGKRKRDSINMIEKAV